MMGDQAATAATVATVSEPGEAYDLLIMVDLTMRSYMKSLDISLPKILSISTLAGSFARIGLLAYRDYCCAGELLHWSGWSDPSINDEDGEIPMQPDVLEKAKALYSLSYGYPHWPSATKTGLAKAYEVMRPEAKTIILLYAEAPPHNEVSHHFATEQNALQNPSTTSGSSSSLFADWVSACKTLRSEKKAAVFPILGQSLRVKEGAGNYYSVLATMTGGACIYLEDSQALTISKVTVDLLLAWMGVEKAVSGASDIKAKMSTYRTIPDANVENEGQLLESPFFDPKNIEHSDLTSKVLTESIPKKKTPVENFARRYKSDDLYKLLVVRQLKKIIDDDVSAISLNPVFGSLWRAVCEDRSNPSRDELLHSFGLKIEQIRDADEKARMKDWLAGSYDFTAEVLEIISHVPEDRRFPCVYLDPTLKFVKPNDSEDPDVEDLQSRPITAFTRDELLEIGRSCDYNILRRLGKVLTNLSFANTPEDLPAHISNADEAKVIKMPLALATNDLNRKFFKILLHIVVPGTVLSSRPAALLAALSIRLGVQPLFEAAIAEMFFWQDKWTNLAVPETWNTNCLSLLLDANKAYLNSQRGTRSQSTDSTPLGLLHDEDKELFDRLVSYKMLDLNMKTALIAKVCWKPEKTFFSMGHQIICKSCHFPRSVTVMGAGHKCGLCAAADYESPDLRQARIGERVTKEDNENTEICWVECSNRVCRAQYVVYHPEALKVRPKCYYCRARGDPAPCVECKHCLSRVLWPEEYRAADLPDFKCIGCSSNRRTIVDVITSASQLCEENGISWVLTNQNGKIKEPFNGRSLFHTISNAGLSSFCSEVSVLPQNAVDEPLYLSGRLIRNASELHSQLMSWVSRRRTESGVCSLCFSSYRKTNLLPACGRSGCHQRICRDCLVGWYGLNGPGRILNVAALICPFCRRSPTNKTLAKHGMGVHAVGNLRTAVSQSGNWIYAWCVSCGFAKPYVERVCAAGAPADLLDWKCEDCQMNAELLLKTKDCPGCGTLTQKTFGCNHMTCTMPKCGVHWCFVCGGKFDEHTIYAHMQTEHGGFYGEVDDDVEEDEGFDIED